MADCKKRCDWCLTDKLYIDYHDNEWGVREFNSERLFEMLALETMQAGLSWITVLRKREAMRSLFFSFKPSKLSTVGGKVIGKWMRDDRIIRHRGKLEALVNNARLFMNEEDFSKLLWEFAPDRERKKADVVPSSTKESDAMSKTLKKKGFGFVGPTTCYSLMQSCGMVNDHDRNCWRYEMLS